MATNKTYVPGNYPQMSGSGGLRKYIQAQLQQVSLSLNALNAQANTSPTVYSDLPAPAASNVGNIRCITDSTVTTGNVTVGGGTNKVLVWSNGTNWKVFAS
jgi:hypothetical protein